jgi:DNA topoisomerase-3
MGKALIIAEKPSVERDIAKALGGFSKSDDHYESDRYVLSSAVGHLLELCVPEKHEVKRGKWTFAHLPVIPPHFDLTPIEKTESRLRVLAKLIRRKDIDCLINACDAGREGELIFRYIVQYTKAKQPIKRLWLQSMTPAAIRDGFAALRQDQEMRPLADAAVCRSESDWLVGINGTRAMTAFNSKSGGFQLTTVGRVQTPTLAILVDREEKIRKFQPKDYWEVHATFQAQAGEYVGRWFDENFQKTKNGDNPDARAERLWNQTQAQTICDKCEGKPGIVTEESKPSTQLSPLLYDLTSLQREANSRFGFSAIRTLSIAQALYEKHKAITYPRTDSRALPEDYLATVKKTLGALADSPYGAFAKEILHKDWVKPSKRIFNNAKITDHFAIIPTPQAPAHLHEAEAKLYDLITKRFLAVFFPAAEFLITTRITRVEGEPFKSEGKVLQIPGWLTVYGRDVPGVENGQLVSVTPGESVQTLRVEPKALQTKPPQRFTEATLLTAMEGAGKLVEDEELREAMSAKGLGTPATRAAIIEGLIHEKYVVRNIKELQPTAKAFSLMALLRGLGIDVLCSPELTGNWEFKLKQMERGELKRTAFMQEIADMTSAIVQKTKSYDSDTVPGDFGELSVPCPKCGGVIKENYRKFQCQNNACDFALWKSMAGRLLEAAEVEQLISQKAIGPLQDFRSRTGRTFAAMLKLNPDGKIEFDFGRNEEAAQNHSAPVDFTGKEPVGKCPKCGASVYENGMSYICQKAVSPERSCAFRAGSVILQQPIERAQMAKLLEHGRTDLLPKFISKKGRPFPAYLVLDKEGNVGFEFEKRPARGKSTQPNQAKPQEPTPPIDFSGQEPVGTCPRCKGRVFETETDYLCEKTQAESGRCTFKTAKIRNNLTLDRVQMAKLLSQRRTDLLQNFISRWGKPFSAWLVLDDKGKVSFEFPEKENQPPPPIH